MKLLNIIIIGLMISTATAHEKTYKQYKSYKQNKYHKPSKHKSYRDHNYVVRDVFGILILGGIINGIINTQNRQFYYQEIYDRRCNCYKTIKVYE